MHPNVFSVARDEEHANRSRRVIPNLSACLQSHGEAFAVALEHVSQRACTTLLSIIRHAALGVTKSAEPTGVPFGRRGLGSLLSNCVTCSFVVLAQKIKHWHGGLDALGGRGATCPHVLTSVEVQRVRAL